MKLHSDSHGFEGYLPEERIPFKIKTSAKLFDILSSGIYKDKILAVIREYACNAFDAHVDAGKHDVPFKLKLPNMIDPTFSIEDEGTGIDPEKIGDIFWTYGESSKTDRNDQIGALGLGSKSAFAYTKSSFIIKNRFNGTEHTYFCFINENGMPDGSLVNSEQTDKNSGITVELAVRTEDISAFHYRTKKFFKYWKNTKPIIKGFSEEEIYNEPPEEVISGDGWYVESSKSSNGRNHALAVMGNVHYPIELESIPNLPEDLKLIANNPFVINFEMGSLSFASSREALSYDEVTCREIISRLNTVKLEIKKSFESKIFDNVETHLDFYKKFFNTYQELKLVIKQYKSNVDETFIKLLLDKSVDDKLTFNGTEIFIKNLIQCRFISERNKFQDYAFYNLSGRSSRSSSLVFNHNTHLDLSATEKILFKWGEGSWNQREYDVNELVLEKFQWRSKFSSKKLKNKDSLGDQVFNNLDKMNVKSINSILLQYSSLALIFVINDVGSTGRVRFKQLVIQNSKTDNILNSQMIFVDFDKKVCSAQDVITDLQDVCKDLTGSSIKLLSELPDYRPEIEREKIEKGCVSLNGLSFYSSSFKSTLDVYINDYSFIDTTVNTNKLKSKIFKKTFSISDLKEKSQVLYCYKRRNDYYDDPYGYKSSLIDDSYKLDLTNHIGLLDDVYEITDQEPKSFEVLVLSKGQHTRLSKKGVKLITITDYVKQKLDSLEDKEQIIKKVNDHALAKNNHLFTDFYKMIKQYNLVDHVQKISPLNNSLFKDLFLKFIEDELNFHISTDESIKFKLLRSFNNAPFVLHDNEDFSVQIFDRYPLLRYMNFKQNNLNSEANLIFINNIFNYVEVIDKQVCDVKEECSLQLEVL